MFFSYITVSEIRLFDVINQRESEVFYSPERFSNGVQKPYIFLICRRGKWISLTSMFCFPNEFGLLSFHKVCVHNHLNKTKFKRKSYVGYWVQSRWRFYSWANGCCPRGSNFLCVTNLPEMEFPRERFHGYVKKNKRQFMTVPELRSMG